MDSFSSIIINAINQVKNAVVRVDLIDKRNGKDFLVGSGSGFIFSSDGMVFTNSHVIALKGTIKVTILDGSEYTADVIGRDPDTDIAILKIYGEGYSVAKLGDSHELQIGQLLIAIGNPLGYQHSVSSGILSGVGRTLRTPQGQFIDNVLQTDAALNPGNSGGPLINSDGEVVGINTAIIMGAHGLSFAIDINTAKEVARQLIEYGKIRKGYLGIMMQEIEIHPRVRNYHKLEANKGLLIISVEGNSPAQKAGLQEGDIIVYFSGERVTSSSNLFKMLTNENIFQLTTITLIRRGQLVELSILPEEKKVTV